MIIKSQKSATSGLWALFFILILMNESGGNTMSFKAHLSNGDIETKSFHNIKDLSQIERLETNDVAPVLIDFAAGEIFVNHVTSNRLVQYFMPNAKPIQYRKVMEEVGLIDYEALYEEAKISAPDKVYLFENALRNPTQETYDLLNTYCSSLCDTIPTKKHEEQTIGYEYTNNNQKIKIEVTSSLELRSVVAHVTLTDLNTKQKTDSYMRLV